MPAAGSTAIQSLRLLARLMVWLRIRRHLASRTRSAPKAREISIRLTKDYTKCAARLAPAVLYTLVHITELLLDRPLMDGYA